MLGEELGSENHNPFNSLENLRTFFAPTFYNSLLIIGLDSKGYDAKHLHLFEEKPHQNSVKYSSINSCD